MTYSDVAALVAQMAEQVGNGCRYTYGQWPADDSEAVPDPPYILFLYPENNDFCADNINYAGIVLLRVELYTDNKDFVAETSVERVFRANDLSYSKYSEYIYDERMYIATYETEVFIHAEHCE